MFDPEIRHRPNKYAEVSAYFSRPDEIEVRGYQSFKINRETKIPVAINLPLIEKNNVLNDWFKPNWLKQRSFLDLGGNNGFFALRALEAGATGATVLDIDSAAMENVRKLSGELSLLNLRAAQTNVKDYNQPADVVLALALVHWIFNLTTGYGSLGVCLEHLSFLAKDALIVEWVDPSDIAISSFAHLSGDKTPDGLHEYTEAFFIEKLKALFDEVHLVGGLTATRRVYIAYRHTFNLDFSWAEDLYLPKATVISSRILASLADGPVWSRVYRGEDKIFKQVTHSTGRQELANLRTIKHPSVPSAEFVEETTGAIIFSMPSLPGITLYELVSRNKTKLSEESIWNIAEQLLSVVLLLNESGIAHRDIHPGNILFDKESNRAFLIDFGWSSALGDSHTPPKNLGAWYEFDGRPAPNIKRDDLFALGALINWLCIRCDISQSGLRLISAACLTLPDTTTNLIKRRLLSNLVTKRHNELPLTDSEEVFSTSILAYRRSYIDELTNRTLEQQHAVAQLHTLEQQHAIELKNQLENNERIIQDLSQQVSELTSNINKQIAQNLAITLERNAIMNSRSMRITKPLRFLADFVRRLRIYFKR